MNIEFLLVYLANVTSRYLNTILSTHNYKPRHQPLESNFILIFFGRKSQLNLVVTIFRCTSIICNGIEIVQLQVCAHLHLKFLIMSFLTSLLALFEPRPVLLDVDVDADEVAKLDFLGVAVSMSIFLIICLLLPRLTFFFLQICFDLFFRKICEYIHNTRASLDVQTMKKFIGY